MNRLLSLLALSTVAFVAASCSPESNTVAKDERLYELRVYHPHPGKLEALHERFRNHTLELFEKHGMENIGYWTTTGEDPKLVYLLAFPDKQAKEKAWEDFLNDPEWQEAYERSIQDGRIVASIDSTLLRPTDYSPLLEEKVSGPDQFFELRTYKTTEGNLSNLDARFREATMDLFEKHGGTNLIYFHVEEGEAGAEDTLIYLMAYEDKEARDAMFEGFGQDPLWKAAREASEKNAGGSLTQPGGVTHQFLIPTDYSKIK